MAVKSTVPIGTCELLQAHFNEKTGAWEILYAEPDGSGHITFRTDHFCEFAVFKYAVEHGYGDLSEDILSFENYGGDAKRSTI